MTDGGSAFPHRVTHLSDGSALPIDHVEGGMSLRDWFAGQALVAITSRRDWEDWAIDAQQAYAAADAMLAEREKRSD